MSEKIKIIDEKSNPEETKNDRNKESNKDLVDKISLDDKEPKKSTKKNGKFKTFLAIILISIFFGALGGGVADRLLLPWLQQKILGNNKNVTVTNQQQNLIVQEQSQTIDAIKKINPAVVSITSVQKTTNLFGQTSTQKSGGTGFILTADGMILTNKHVVEAVKDDITVLTYDGKTYSAKVLAQDPLNDIAVIKISADNLPTVEIGSAQDLVVGQTVIAIGNALGQYQNTVTSGIISAVGRTVTAGGDNSAETLENTIQTDASINPGNSGGPLANLAGQVVGINTAIDSSGQTIGFAIPIDMIKPVDTFIKNLREKSAIIRPFMGIRYINLNSEIASANNIKVSDGALIYSNDSSKPAVAVGGPSDKAGLKSGDIITAINGDKVTSNKSVSSILQKYQPGNEIEVTYLRDDKEQKTKVTLGETK